jgi:hypothetical protein
LLARFPVAVGQERLVERVEQPGGLEVVDARQVARRAQAEVGQELLRGRVEQRPARPFAAAAGRTQPASISTSSVPLEICTPRIASISARLTGS